MEQKDIWEKKRRRQEREEDALRQRSRDGSQRSVGEDE